MVLAGLFWEFQERIVIMSSNIMKEAKKTQKR